MWAPHTTYADDATVLTGGSDSAHYFDPAPQDTSMLYLSEIFGPVGTLLPGSGSTLLSDLFGALNPMILALGIVFAAYAAFTGIINTAGEGEMLGKKMHSIWIPLRIVIGIAGLIPITSSGYCVIQVFVMWMATQGIGAADNIWNTAVDYIKAGKPIYVSTKYGAFANPAYETAVQTIFQSLTCQQSLYYNYPDQNPDGPPTTPDPVEKVNSKGNHYTISYTFGGNGDNGDPVDCGTVTFSDDSINAGSVNSTMKEAIEQAMTSIMPSLNAVAYYYVNYPIPDDTDDPVNYVDNATYDFVGSDYITNIEGTYNSALVSGASQDKSGDNNSDAWDWAEKYGWLTAGGLYFKIAKLNDSYSESTVELGIVKQWSDGFSPSDVPITTVKNDMTNAGNFITNLQATYYNNAGVDGYYPSSNSDHYNGTLTSLSNSINQDFENSLGSDSKNPIVSAQSLGHKILIAVEICWLALMVLLGGAAAVDGLMASIQSGWLVQITLMSMVVPLFFFILGALTTLGMTLAVLVPLLPLTIFSIAAIGWMVVVIEAMVAAPLIMIGIMYPDGHEVWGKAEPAILIVVNMFLRPSLMIIGMLAGMLVSYVALSLVNMGFSATINTLHNTNNQSYTSMLESIGYLSVYVGLFLMVLNESFSLIIVVPDKVFRYLQGGEGAGAGRGLQEGMQKVQGQFDQGSQQAKELGNTAGQSAQRAGETARGFGYERRQAEAEKARTKAGETLSNKTGDRRGPTSGQGGGNGNIANGATSKAPPPPTAPPAVKG